MKPKSTTSPLKMPNHKACFHLNEIMQRKQEEMTDWEVYTSSTLINDRTSGTKRPATEEEIVSHNRFVSRQREKLTLEIEALDIAATALTR